MLVSIIVPFWGWNWAGCCLFRQLLHCRCSHHCCRHGSCYKGNFSSVPSSTFRSAWGMHCVVPLLIQLLLQHMEDTGGWALLHWVGLLQILWPAFFPSSDCLSISIPAWNLKKWEGARKPITQPRTLHISQVKPSHPNIPVRETCPLPESRYSSNLYQRTPLPNQPPLSRMSHLVIRVTVIRGCMVLTCHQCCYCKEQLPARKAEEPKHGVIKEGAEKAVEFGEEYRAASSVVFVRDGERLRMWIVLRDSFGR